MFTFLLTNKKLTVTSTEAKRRQAKTIKTSDCRKFIYGVNINNK